MTPIEFVRKWGAKGTASKLNERAGAQQHFLDLCRTLAVPEPDDPEAYCFERSFLRHNKAVGYADVWKRDCFAWEYKRPGASLSDALDQLMRYAMPLENPPLLVVSDREHFEIHTHFTGYASVRTDLDHADLLQPEARAMLRDAFVDPYKFRPNHTSIEITKDAARGFAAMAERMQSGGIDPQQAAHFLTQCLFCLFAQDVGLLKTELFKDLTANKQDASGLQRGLTKLFKVMRTGGDFGVENIPWFNGGLFEIVEVPKLDAVDIQALRNAAKLDWRGLDPSIFGTLFERGLNPEKRRQFGAHYTDPETISKLVVPVIESPLLGEWMGVKDKIAELLKQGDRLRRSSKSIPSTSKIERGRYARTGAKAKVVERLAQDLFNGYLERLRDFRVLDPACGSGNFLYVALRSLKDIEHRVNTEAEGLGLHRQLPMTGPQNLLGIEINPYAAELSRVTVWIGELQWRMRHGFGWKQNPILDPLDQIECRDALLGKHGEETTWPAADVVVGNPPFVGNKKMRAELGSEYVESVRSAYAGVPAGADFVCYWFEKARLQIEASRLQRAGLVATNSIRGGRNREVIDRLLKKTPIFEAWSDEPWINEGAAVRVSLVGFGHHEGPVRLNGDETAAITADLSGARSGHGPFDITLAKKLHSNSGACFMGVTKVGPFDIPGEIARAWLAQPNAHGQSNAAVIARSWNGLDAMRRDRDVWIIDFGISSSVTSAALFEAPFEFARHTIYPFRQSNNRESYRTAWWRHGEARPGLRRLLAAIPRFIVTPEVSKHRVFLWAPGKVVPDKNLQVTPRSDDTTFGVLHSRFHELWSLRTCTWMGKGNDPRYTPTTCFETFPFPIGLAPADTAHQRTELLPDYALIPADLTKPVRSLAVAISRAAKRLSDLRSCWLNPPEWSELRSEIVPLGLSSSPFPDRIVARPGFEHALEKRTLTNLYNLRPAWLVAAHEALDAAVAAAYGWTDYTSRMTDEEILMRLLHLNLRQGASQPGSQSELALLGLLGKQSDTAAKGSGQSTSRIRSTKRAA